MATDDGSSRRTHADAHSRWLNCLPNSSQKLPQAVRTILTCQVKSDNIGEINTDPLDTTLHYVPFTYCRHSACL